MAVFNIKDVVFFLVPPQEEDKPKIVFTWEGTQYTFNCLPQGYKYSPTTAHNALVELLQQMKILEGVQIYEYTDDVLIEGEDDGVRTTAQNIWNKLNYKGIETLLPDDNALSKDVKFPGTWWVASQAAIPDVTITKLDAIPILTT